MNEKIDKDIRMTTIPTWIDCSIPGRKNPYKSGNSILLPNEFASGLLDSLNTIRWKVFHQDIRDNQALASK